VRPKKKGTSRRSSDLADLSRIVPIYAYRGVHANGRATKGSVTADSERTARSRMRAEGVFLTEITESQADSSRAAKSAGGSGGRFDFNFSRPIPSMERAIATRQLATLVGAGIPLVDSLTTLVQQIEHARLKSVMDGVRDRVNEGASLADALQQSGQFDNLFVSMVRAGEASGALAVVLSQVADYLEDAVRLRNKVTSIMVYPSVMLVFALLVVAALVTVVLPQITSLLLSLNQPLPFYTVWIIEGSAFARQWWWAIFAAVGLFFGGFRMLIRTTSGHSAWDRLCLRLPVVGAIVRVLAIARFSRTLSTLLGAGVGIVRALEISEHVANNVILGAAIANARTSVVEGAPLAAPLRASGEFPPLVTTMIDVGEHSGNLEEMLVKVASTYDEQVENTISRLTSLLEPLLILVMVGIVLVIILATLMPLMQITGSLS